MADKKRMRILFFVYLLLLLKVIVFKFPIRMLGEMAARWRSEAFAEGIRSANFDLSRTIKMNIRYWDRAYLHSFSNLAGNIVVFVPFGFMLPCVWSAAESFLVTAATAFLFVTAVELFQLLSGFGVFDVDDILLNCAGALLGYLLYAAAVFFRQKISRKK